MIMKLAKEIKKLNKLESDFEEKSEELSRVYVGMLIKHLDSGAKPETFLEKLEDCPERALQLGIANSIKSGNARQLAEKSRKAACFERDPVEFGLIYSKSLSALNSQREAVHAAAVGALARIAEEGGSFEGLLKQLEGVDMVENFIKHAIKTKSRKEIASMKNIPQVGRD